MLGERHISTDQLKVGTGTDEKYEILNECNVVAELRRISKFQASAMQNLIGEYLRDKVVSEIVVFDAPAEIAEPKMQAAPMMAPQQQPMYAP